MAPNATWHVGRALVIRRASPTSTRRTRGPAAEPNELLRFAHPVCHRSVIIGWVWIR